MKPPAVGSVWVRKPSPINLAGQMPVTVLASTERDVVHTDSRGASGRIRSTLEQFWFYYQPAPQDALDFDGAA